MKLLFSNRELNCEVPPVKTSRFPVSWTKLALTCGLIFIPSKVFVSTGVYSLKSSAGVFILYFSFLPIH